MKIKHLLASALLSAAAVTSAQTVVRPGDATVLVSPAFGPAAELVTDQYNSFGLNFSSPTAIFTDPPLAWSGVSATNVVDLVSPIDAFFTLAGTTTDAVTSFLSVEIGFSDVGNLTLEAFDINGILIGSTLNDDGLGPNGRTLASLSVAGIHSFRVSTNGDSFGINQVEFGRLDAAAPIPEPSTYALMVAGLCAVGMVARRRPRA